MTYKTKMNRICFLSPLGFLDLKEENGALTGLCFVDKCTCQNDTTPLLCEAKQQLTEYFAGERRDFSLPVNPYGTDFQKSVWIALMNVPFGETKSYGQIARIIGRPKAFRAVGMACNKNPIAVIVPCHRVIGSNGKLVGYGSGLNKKLFLLDLEKQSIKD